VVVGWLKILSDESVVAVYARPMARTRRISSIKLVDWRTWIETNVQNMFHPSASLRDHILTPGRIKDSKWNGEEHAPGEFYLAIPMCNVNGSYVTRFLALLL
jgi:hypothetical protein